MQRNPATTVAHHWQAGVPPADGTPIEEYWPAFLDLRDQGKVRAVGLSNHDVPMLDAAEALGHVDSLQPKFSAVYRDAAADVLPRPGDHPWPARLLARASRALWRIPAGNWYGLEDYRRRTAWVRALWNRVVPA